MRFKKDSPFIMYFKQNLQKDFGFFHVDMARFKAMRRRPCPVSSTIEKLPQLPTPRPIYPLRKI